MADQRTTPSELDRSVAVGEVGAAGLRRRLRATPAEREALARRYGIIEIKELDAEFEVTPERRGRYRLRASFTAEVGQACVVTLEPVAGRVADSFEVVFAPDAEAANGAGDVVVDATAEDPPEPIVAGRIAVGEMLAQYLALALDPYPRCAGAAFEVDTAPAATAGDDRESPFAILRKLG